MDTLRRVAANQSFVPFGVHGVDARRSALAVTDREGWLRLLDAETLQLRREWHVDAEAVGTHAVRASDQVALVSGVESVTLLDPRGERVWTFRHEAPWQHGGFERGWRGSMPAGSPSRRSRVPRMTAVTWCVSAGGTAARSRASRSTPTPRR